MNADLHCHSTVSDGTLTPQGLARRAADQGVQLWALTDHDEVRGQAEAAHSANALGLSYLPGVEVSVSFADTTVHILGLGIDPESAVLRAGLADVRSGRQRRAEAMAAGLADVGIAGAYEGALRYVGNPDLISRTHFARYLVEHGVCTSTSEVFQRYLTPGKPGFVAHEWGHLAQVIDWIRQAGGMAVIAHPARYAFKPNLENAFFNEFVSHGGQGVEVVTGNHSVQEQHKYADMAREFDLYASRGSDFHSPQESRVDLGCLPDLPSDLTPVWDALGHRIQMP
jgi:3',5'-nucleoside bisphosphate phosphatase